MTRWLVQITGERVDLLEFQRLFPAGEAHIVEEDGQYFLTGSSFDRAADAADAQSHAAEIVDDMFPVVSIAWRIARKPEVGNVIYEDNQGNRHLTMLVPLAGLRMHAMSAGEAPVDGGRLLAKLRSSPHLRAAGKSWSTPHRSWSHLYNIYKELNNYLGKAPEPERMGATRTRFTQSAQSHDVAGVNARHESGRVKAPPDPMTLQEAEDFILDVMGKVLKQP